MTLSMINIRIVKLWIRGGIVIQPRFCEQRYPNVAGIVTYLLSHSPGAFNILDCCRFEVTFEFLVAFLAENNRLERLTSTTRIQNIDTATLEND
jgi:hypothetical protein